MVTIFKSFYLYLKTLSLKKKASFAWSVFKGFVLAEISAVMSEFPYDAYKNSIKQPNIWLSFSLGQHVQERIQALIASAPTLVVPLENFYFDFVTANQ